MRTAIVEYLLPYGISYVPDYYALYALMVIVGLTFSTRRAIKAGFPGLKFLMSTAAIILCSFLGARLYGIMTNIKTYQATHEYASLVLRGETGSFGAYAGAIIGGIIVTRRANFDPWDVWDIYAPYIAFSVFLGRIGCFMAGCCYGKISDVPWAVRYPRFSLPFIRQQLGGELSPYAAGSHPVHPTQLYESAFGLALFILLLALSKKPRVPGFSILVFFLLYSSFRFVTEFFRGDSQIFVGPISLPQILYLIIFISALMILLTRLPSADIGGGSADRVAVKRKGSEEPDLEI